jgi:hypothetical protein
MNEPILRADTPSCVIPFTRAGNLILIKASVDSVEGNFVLDTGAPNLVLNITYFRDYPVEHLSDAVQTGVTGNSTASVLRTRVKLARLGTFRYYKADADLVSLGHIENARGVKILGLIGVQFFRQCELIIDYEKNLIYLHLINRKEASVYHHPLLKRTSEYQTVPFELMDNRIVAKTEMAGKKLKFIIDCASETNIIHSQLPDKVLEHVTITRRVMLTGSGTRKVEALYGDMKSLKMGGRDLGTLPVLVTNLENTCFSYNGCIDGVLGFDFLSLQRIGFNFVTRKMYIWK